MIVKHEGAKTVVFIGVILLMGVVITGMFLKNQTMVIIGVAILLAAALLGSVVLVFKLSRRFKNRSSAEPVASPEDEYERQKEKSERRRAPVREILKNTLLLGGFLTSCVLFVILCSVKQFVLACIVWGSGVGLTLLAFVVMLVRERIQKSDLGRDSQLRHAERENRREQAERAEYDEYARNIDEHGAQPERFIRPDREAPEPDFGYSFGSAPQRRASDISGKYRIVEAAVRSVELIDSRADTVDCGGQPMPRRYGLYRVVLQSGGDTKTAVSAVAHRRGEFVNALFSADSDSAVIVTGSEIKLGSGRYKQVYGKVKMCIVDIASMVEKRRRVGDEYSSADWAVDPDHRFIITADVDGRRVRAESEIYYTEGTSVDLLECRGNAVAVFID